MSLYLAAIVLAVLPGVAAAQRSPWSEAERTISQQLSSLRKTADHERPAVTGKLALAIRNLPATSPAKVMFASSLANLATEGDCGRENLQAVADTLARAITEARPAADKEGPNRAYAALARLGHYEGVTVSIDDPQYRTAISDFQAIDKKRQSASFRLRDLSGQQWALDELRGKVVLVNFWATWCPPCRKEMPDMEALHRRFKDQGLVVLAITDEEEGIVRKYLSEHPYSFPVLLDPGRQAAQAYGVQGIPQSMVYDRAGQMVAIAVDQRTESQFLRMLAKAGLE
jgi:peroxiredoxin